MVMMMVMMIMLMIMIIDVLEGEHFAGAFGKKTCFCIDSCALRVALAVFLHSFSDSALFSNAVLESGQTVTIYGYTAQGARDHKVLNMIMWLTNTLPAHPALQSVRWES